MKYTKRIKGETYTHITEERIGFGPQAGDSWALSRLSAAVVLLVALATAAPVKAGNQGVGPGSPTPAGFTKYLVYLGESTAAPGEPGLFMDADHVNHFQHVIMQRTPAEVAAEEADAEQFFWQRFGLNFTATEPDANGVQTIPGATFQAFVQNEAANYRAYTISGESVPSQGWLVRDGGWIVTLTEDMVLHGDYGGAEGKSAPAGAVVVFGNYNILVENKSQHEDPPKPQAADHL
ncbi:MAG: hypothetical protein L0Z50_18500 [Verrucomicrobiales bacterium]|nr:hypothetical protein [Verrucomicrobiales bacterium]